MNRLAVAGGIAVGVHTLVLTISFPALTPRHDQKRRAHAVTVTLGRRPPKPAAIVRPAATERIVKPKPKHLPVHSAPPKARSGPVRKPEPVPEPVAKAEAETPVIPPELHADPVPVARTRPAVKTTRQPGDDAPAPVPSSPADPFPDSTAGLREATPLYRVNRPPRYPRLARRRGWEGVVLLDVAVSAEGRVGDVSVNRSSGFPVLDDEAVRAVRQWRFEPGRRQGRPAAMQVQVPIRFRLKEGKK